ncbi:hypothetical protein O6H91_18G025100 [Diphasiastrum complanatum]|uniref:Uncharacterized protein n=1 Tax=Diphasiastrum complanatum TaxID=34168 RepID=A0ACC2B056_DIPCM|nr:hypothetical protein O6H91_18G025100 [Diphasiastrum complanatum]
MSGPDRLFSLRNNFYLGAYQAAINESNVGGLTEAQNVEKDCLVYRSYIALGSYQEKSLSSLQEWLSDVAIANNPTLLMIAGTIYAQEQNFNEALKYTNGGGTLELHALNVQIFLKIYRTDHAEKQLKIMQQIDEDHTLTQLASAWLCLALGGSKIQEAFYIFQELCEKYTWTVPIMNGRAVCNMHMGHFEDAETVLLEALNKDAKDADTIANLIVCNLHLGKPTSRYLNQLKMVDPDHPLLKRSANAQEAFERALQNFS